MYSVLLVNVVTLAAMSFRRTPSIYSIIIPVVLSATVAWRLFYVVRQRRVQITAHQAAAEQRAMVLRSAGLSVGYAFWVINVIGEGDVAQAAVAAMLAYVSALGCAFGLASLPSASRAAVVLATVPVAIDLLVSGNTLLSMLGVNLLLASGLAVRMLTHHQENFINGIRSKIALAAESARARAAELAADRLARTDALTGLVNRRGLLEALDAASNHPQNPFALILFDLDGFKPVNDRHGHPAGDELLVECGRRLTASLGSESTVARLGGDEFAIIVPGVSEQTAARELAGGLSTQLAAPLRLSNGDSVRVTACFGLSLFPMDGRDATALLSRADVLLYAGKRARTPAPLSQSRGAGFKRRQNR